VDKEMKNELAVRQEEVIKFCRLYYRRIEQEINFWK